MSWADYFLVIWNKVINHIPTYVMAWRSFQVELHG
jgi:hypothetical protein